MPEPLRVPAGCRLRPEYCNGLVGHWKMNVGGVLIPDLSGYNNHGTRTNMANPPTAISGWAGLGDILDGVDDYVNIIDNNIFSFGNGIVDTPFSISAWVKMNDATDFKIVGKGSSNSNGEYRIITGSDDILSFITFDNSVSSCYFGRRFDTALTSYEGRWIHIIGVYDGSASSAGFKLYINGVRVDDANNQHNGVSYVAMENLTANVQIGKYTGGVNNYSNGLIDDVRIYNRALRAAEIAHAYYQQEDEWDLGLDDDLAIMQGIPIELMRGGVA